MLTIISLSVLFLSFLFLFLESYRADKRKKRIQKYIEIDVVHKKTFFSFLFLKFGKENHKELEKKFIDAGIYKKQLAKYYFPGKLIVLVLLCGIIFISDMQFSTKVMFCMFSLIAVIVVPDMILDIRKKALIHRVSSKLPYLLDMMAVCAQTGMTIEACFSYLAQELESFDKDLCYQVKRTSDSAKFHGLEKALDDLSGRIPTAEVRSFVLTIIQNLQYGTSIAQVLTDLAEDMRKSQLLTVEEKVGQLSAKMSIPLILFIMFPIIVLILGPSLMQLNL